MRKLLLLLLFILNFSFPVYSQETFKLATGSEGGVYFSIGLGLRAAIEKSCPEMTIALLPTAGSIENAWLLSNNEVQFALIQSDIAEKFRTGNDMFKFPSESMEAIATLFPEAIHIVVRKGSGIKTLEDLRGKIISVGEKNSGTRYNAEDILKYSGIDEREITKKYLSPNEVTKAFKDGSIDVAFYTTAVPNHSIVSISDIVEIINLDSTFISGLIKMFPYFKKNSIPQNSYPGQRSVISSVGTNLLLVVRKEINKLTIKNITEAIFKNRTEIIKSHVVAKKIDIENSYQINALKLHSGASEFYKDSERMQRAFSDYLVDGVIYIFLFFVIAYSSFNHRKFLYFYSKNQYFQIGVILFLFFTIGTLGTYWSERAVNKDFDNLIETFWTTIIYLLSSGLDGATPVTVSGKIFSIIILIGSVALLGSVIGHFTSFFIRERKKKMPINLEKHIAICYWSSRGDTIIKELRNSEMAAEKEIIVLHDNVVNEKELRDKNDYYKNVFFIEGAPTKTKTLSDARIAYAESIIILAGTNDATVADPMTILTCLSIEKLCTKLVVKKPRIIAELMNRENREIALSAGADEIVSAGFYRTGIMLQSALFPNLSDIFHELLSYGTEKTSVYILDENHYSSDLFGKSFQDITSIINKNRKEDNPIILLGIRRDNKVMLNPQANLPEGSDKYFDVLKEGDSLAVIAQKHPSLKKIKI
jgi:TRAP transporter TAXI family solute receptor